MHPFYLTPKKPTLFNHTIATCDCDAFTLHTCILFLFPSRWVHSVEQVSRKEACQGEVVL